jgi:hypothetical protein
LNVTVVGAGNLGHVFAGQLGARCDVKISVLSRKADSIAESMMKSGVTVCRQSPKKGVSDEFVTGKVHRVSSNAKDVIPDADMVIVTVPSHARLTVLNQIAPHLNSQKPVFLGAMPGLGGFDWIADHVCRRYSLPKLTIFSIKDVPYMATQTVPGKSVTNLGPKTTLFLAVNNSKDSMEMRACAHLITKLCDNTPCVLLDSFVTIALTPGNPIMHPSIMYGMFGPYSQWDGKPLAQPPLFYEEVGELSSYFLTKADHEVQLIKLAVAKATNVDLTAVWPLRANLKHVYGDLVGDNRNLMLAMRTNRAYERIRTPLKKDISGGFVPDLEHRFFREDVPFGLVILRDIADIVNVKTPMIDELIEWSQGLMQKSYLVEGKLKGRDMFETGAPSQYNIFKVQDLVFGHLRGKSQAKL